jgi:hypothetical protein
MTDETNDTHTRPNLSTEPGRKDPAPTGGTQTQPRPNISTEHQQDGDARSPKASLDRGQSESPASTPGGIDQEKVEDRPNVSTVTPDDYPQQQ